MHDHQSEARWAREFIADVIRIAPRRQPTSLDERRAQERVAQEFASAGLSVSTPGFRFQSHLYASLALHFGIAVVGSLVGMWWPLAGALVHALVAVSYVLDSTRRAFVLRRLLRWGDSVNVVGTLNPQPKPRVRVVFMGHTDAAFTGLLFEPWFVRHLGAKPGPLYKSLRVAVLSLVGLVLLEVGAAVAGAPGWWAYGIAALTFPSLAAAVLNLDIVLRDRIVPGANDNLSGVAGCVLLARRLKDRVAADVEVVFVATGCEEASLGGADALSRSVQQSWDRGTTWVVGLDGLSNGDLRWFHEGEVFSIRPNPELEAHLQAVARSEARWGGVTPFVIPVGGSDAVPFLLRGYRAVTLGCVDSTLGMPRNYHHPSDTVENLDEALIPVCVDFAERLFDRLAASENGAVR